MSSCNQTRAWEAPVATALSIRSTANQAGSGGDTFLRLDNLGRNAVAPAAPISEVNSVAPVRTETATGSDQRTWEGPVVTSRTI